MISNTPEQRQYFQHNSLWCLTSCYCSLPLSSVSFFFPLLIREPVILVSGSCSTTQINTAVMKPCLVSVRSTVSLHHICFSSSASPLPTSSELSASLPQSPLFFILLFNICNEIVFCRFQNDFSLSYIHHKVIRSDIWASVYPVKSLDFSFFFISGTTTAGVSDK